MNTRRHERTIDEVEVASWIADGMTIAIGQPTPISAYLWSRRRDPSIILPAVSVLTDWRRSPLTWN